MCSRLWSLVNLAFVGANAYAIVMRPNSPSRMMIMDSQSNNLVSHIERSDTLMQLT